MQMVELDGSFKLPMRPTLAKDLSADILSELSMILNPPLIGKDYKYLAGKMGKSFQIVRWLEMQKDPTASLLEHWWSDSGSKTVEDLIILLKKIERYDAVKVLEPHTHCIVRSRPTSTVSASSIKEATEHDLSDTSNCRSSDDEDNLRRNSFASSERPSSYCTGSFLTNNLPSRSSESTVHIEENDPDEDLDKFLEDKEDEHLRHKIGQGPSETIDSHPVYIYTSGTSLKSLSSNNSYDSNVSQSSAALMKETSILKSKPILQPINSTSPLDAKVALSVNQMILKESTAVVASDKIALLIGNQTYKHRGELCYPSRDVEAFTFALKELGFKVLSLVDLNLTEMRTVMLSFCKLLGHGVFALFYFAGHGFEENGENYLIPVDASPSFDRDEFIAAQEILCEMQLRGTALNLCIIDACRVIGKDLHSSDSSRPCRLRRGTSGNTIVAYSCQPATEAYEIIGESNGVYMTELLKHIKKDARIEHILMEVNKAVNCNPLIIQRPVFESDSADDCRLTCKIDPHANIAHWQSQRFEKWIDASIPPEAQLLFKEEELLEFKLEYDALFSNKLRINVFMKNSNEEPLELDKFELLNGSDLTIIERKVSKSVRPKLDKWTEVHDFIIKDMQKISSELLLVFQLEYRLKGANNFSEPFHLDLKINMGFPLISAHFREFHQWICEDKLPGGHKNTWV